jgi:hypothetical protein
MYAISLQATENDNDLLLHLSGRSETDTKVCSFEGSAILWERCINKLKRSRDVKLRDNRETLYLFTTIRL